MKPNDIVNLIQQNKKDFQANFSLIKPKEKIFTKEIQFQINIKKFQTNNYVIGAPFYKRISRM